MRDGALGSNRIRIVFDPANLYRPPANPRRDRHVITDALTLLGDRTAIAHCKDIAAPAAEAAARQPGETLYAHVAAGRGILDYHHYISELRRLASTSVPLILHGLSEEQIPRAVAFVRSCLSELGACAGSMNP
jgi:sugar phosphate isomerase/epimerase